MDIQKMSCDFAACQFHTKSAAANIVNFVDFPGIIF
jgi:hypothetical protein